MRTLWGFCGDDKPRSRLPDKSTPWDETGRSLNCNEYLDGCGILVNVSDRFLRVYVGEAGPSVFLLTARSVNLGLCWLFSFCIGDLKATGDRRLRTGDPGRFGELARPEDFETCGIRVCDFESGLSGSCN